MNECKHNPIVCNGDVVCSECGMILDKHFSQRPLLQKSRYDDTTLILNKIHKKTFHEYSRTMIGSSKDKHKQAIKQRIRKRNNYGRGDDIRITHIYSAVSMILNIPLYISDSILYSYIKIKKNEKVYNKPVLLGTCIYDICKYYEIPHINIKNICETFKNIGSRINTRLITNAYLKYSKYMRSDKTNLFRYVSYLIDNIISFNGIEDRLTFKKYNISKEELRLILEKETIRIMGKFPRELLYGLNPINFTATSIYVAGLILKWRLNKKTVLSQKYISEATNIAEYSIRDLYNKYYKNILKRDGIV